ncbi:MAG: hypothetical protein E2O86_03830 [Bacteroidetes bacterium]|nr:MAG: hypothetical protein E2O86_03830 [Bacteroidota bacterium]
MKRKFYILAAILLFTTLPFEAQCAMCRAVLESSENVSVAKGINNGIVYLMLFPYLFIGGVGYFIYRMYKKSKTNEN